MLGGLASWFGNLGAAIANIASQISNLPSAIINGIVQGFQTVLEGLFVPSDGFFDEQFNAVKYSLEAKLSYESFTDILTNYSYISKGELNNITARIPLINQDVTIVDFGYFQQYKNDIHNWVRGFMYIFLILYNFNFVYKLIRKDTFFTGGGQQSVSHKGGDSK